MRLPDTPSVLVLLVATDGATWLPDVLRGLRAQQHRPLKVLAVDNGSSDGSDKILEKAFGVRRVVTLERKTGYGRAIAAALKVAAERGHDADAFLLLHDDAALAPGALEAMIDALRGDDVGIVGAKLLEWDDQAVLQDIGSATDRYGRTIARVERGEIDQGQHEGTHEVLFATSAALLVAREVIEKVGLFDLRFVALRDDLDLCWRARLAGYRTVVTTAASARHASATTRELRPSPVARRVRYFGDRNMIATLIKNYSWPRLALALPVTFMVSLVNAVLYLIRGRRSSALQVLEALQWNVVRLPGTLRARAKAQALRAVPDAEVTALMQRGASRFREQFERAVETVVGEIDEGSEEDLDAPPPRLIDRVRAHPGGVVIAFAVVVGLLGARILMSMPQVAGLELAPFPSAGGFFREFASGWRGAGDGGAGAATPGLTLLGALTFLSFGSGWLAQRVVLFGLPLLAAIAMLRFGRAFGLSPAATRVATVLYAMSPLVLGSFGAGRLPDLVLAACAPLVMMPLLRAAGALPEVGWRSTWAGIAGVTLASSLAPWTLAFVAGSGVVIGVASARDPKGSTARVLRRTAAIVGAALVLLFPWSVELFRPGSPIGGGGSDPAADMRHLLALSAAAVRPIPIALGFGATFAAVLGALGSRGARRRVAALVGGIGLVGLGAAWAVTRGVPWIAPRPALPLVATGVAVAFLAGLAVERAAGLAERRFGLGHVAAVVAGGAIVAQVLAASGWIAFGARPGLTPSGELVLTSFESEVARTGAYRIAWLSGTADEPQVALSDHRGRTMREFLARPGGAGADALRAVVGAIASGSTEAGGRMLATFGVRYVIARPEADPALIENLRAQVDLELNNSKDSIVYANNAPLPTAHVTASGQTVAVSRGTIGSAAILPIGEVPPGLASTRSGEYRGEASAGEAILLAEDFSDGWRARVGDRDLTPSRSFGWATRFDGPIPADGPIVISWAGQRWHRAALILEAILALAFLLWRSQRAARDRGER